MRRDRLYVWLRSHPIVPDAVLAALLFLALVVPIAIVGDPGWPYLVAGGVMYGGLIVRRTSPVVSFAVVGVAGLGQWIAGLAVSINDFGVLLGLYSVSAYGPRWASRAGLAAGLVGAVLGAQRYEDLEASTGFGSRVILLAVAVLGAWALGDLRRVRQAYLGELVERARQAERERDQRAQIAAADERARIARDMHDVIAHNLSVIVVQADGGRYAASHDPDRAVSALDTISATGRNALGEMRRLLGVLRSDDQTDGGPERRVVGGSDELAPQPDLGSLPELVESFQHAGLPVDVDVTGEVQPIANGPSLAAFRAVQEALTNVLKHAGSNARATIRLAYHDNRVEAEVEDDGRGAASAARSGAEGGLGLRGMGERLAIYGGGVSAGPRPGGGWRVAVTLPIEPVHGDGS